MAFPGSSEARLSSPVDDDWEARRPFVQYLYLVQKGGSHTAVRDFMRFCGFNVTANQVQYRLKKWNMWLNLSESEWQEATEVLRRRQGKQSQVVLSGVPLALSKIEKRAKKSRTGPAHHKVSGRNKRHEADRFVVRSPPPPNRLQNYMSWTWPQSLGFWTSTQRITSYLQSRDSTVLLSQPFTASVWVVPLVMMAFSGLQWADTNETATSLECSLRRFLPERNAGESEWRANQLLHSSPRDQAIQSLHIFLFAISNNLFSPRDHWSWDMTRLLFQTGVLKLLLQSGENRTRDTLARFAITSALGKLEVSPGSREGLDVIDVSLSSGYDSEFPRHQREDDHFHWDTIKEVAETPLECAARIGNPRLLDILLKHAVKPPYCGVLAACGGLPDESVAMEMVTRLVSAGATLRHRDDFASALHSGHVQVFRLLAKQCPHALFEPGHMDVQMGFEDENCLFAVAIRHPIGEERARQLFFAVQEAHESVLLDVQTFRNKLSHTWLLWAAEQGHDSIVRWLADDLHVDVNHTVGFHGQPVFSPLSAICLAAANGRLQTCRLLVEELGARADQVFDWDNSEVTPLQLAAHYGHLDVIRYLLEATRPSATPGLLHRHRLHRGYSWDSNRCTTPLAAALHPLFYGGGRYWLTAIDNPFQDRTIPYADQSQASQQIQCAHFLLQEGSLPTGLELKVGILWNVEEFVKGAFNYHDLGQREWLYCERLRYGKLDEARRLCPDLPADCRSLRGDTALQCVVWSGNVDAINQILDKNPGYYDAKAMCLGMSHLDVKGMNRVVERLLDARPRLLDTKPAEVSALALACFLRPNLDAMGLLTTSIPFTSFRFLPDFMITDWRVKNEYLQDIARECTRRGLAWEMAEPEVLSDLSGVFGPTYKVSALGMALIGVLGGFQLLKPTGFTDYTNEDLYILARLWPKSLAKDALGAICLAYCPYHDEVPGGVVLLICAAHQGKEDLVNLLLQKGYTGTRIKYRRPLFSPLLAAVKRGHLPIVSSLLCKGVDVKKECWDTGHEALQTAALNGDLVMALVLINHGADINHPGHLGGGALYIDWDFFDGLTALQAACKTGRMDMVDLLLDHGAKVDGLFYRLALQRAVFLAEIGGHMEISRSLRQKVGWHEDDSRSIEEQWKEPMHKWYSFDSWYEERRGSQWNAYSAARVAAPPSPEDGPVQCWGTNESEHDNDSWLLNAHSPVHGSSRYGSPVVPSEPCTRVSESGVESFAGLDGDMLMQEDFVNMAELEREVVNWSEGN